MPAIYTGYEVDIVYTVSSLEHRARFKIKPVGTPTLGMDLSTLELYNRYGFEVDFSVLLDGIVTYMKPFYNAGVAISRAELWWYNEDGSGRDYISQIAIDEIGTGAAPILANQVIFTFRTLGGHVAKFYLMETNVNSVQILRPPYPAGAIDDLSAWLTAADTAVYAGDETFVWANLGAAIGQNERLFRKRYRP